MIGMQLSLHVELDVMSQWVTKGLMGSMATGHGIDVSASCLWMSARPLSMSQLTCEAWDGGWGGGCSKMDRQSLNSRHIECSHMAATHSVMRATRPCCLSVDWGLRDRGFILHLDANEHECIAVFEWWQRPKEAIIFLWAGTVLLHSWIVDMLAGFFYCKMLK